MLELQSLGARKQHGKGDDNVKFFDKSILIFNFDFLCILQNALVTTYDCGDIVTTFLHKETKLTRRKFEWVEHNILEFLVKTFCIPLL